MESQVEEKGDILQVEALFPTIERMQLVLNTPMDTETKLEKVVLAREKRESSPEIPERLGKIKVGIMGKVEEMGDSGPRIAPPGEK